MSRAASILGLALLAFATACAARAQVDPQDAAARLAAIYLRYGKGA